MRKLAIILFSFMLFPISVFAEGESCTSNEECAEGEYCMLLPQDLAIDCPPCEGEDCPPCDEGGSGDDEKAGECKKPKAPEPPPEELQCDASSDCPLGFTCEEQTIECKGAWGDVETPDVPPSFEETETACFCECEPGDKKCEETCECGDDEDGDEDGGEDSDDGGKAGSSPMPEGNMDCEPLVVNICAYDTSSCSSDADCIEGFVCHSVERCSSGGGVATDCACAEGEECDCNNDDVPVPEPEEEECEVVSTLCIPGETKCTEDADCLEGWICESPPGNVDAEGDDDESENRCLPIGFMETMGTMIGAGMSPTPDGMEESSDTSLGSLLQGGGDDAEGGDGKNTTPPIASQDEDAGGDSGSGLCSMGNNGRFGVASLMLLLLFAGLLASRREGFEG